MLPDALLNGRQELTELCEEDEGEIRRELKEKCKSVHFMQSVFSHHDNISQLINLLGNEEYDNKRKRIKHSFIFSLN